jgi:environmental stress-induced protein Ves
MTGTPASAAPAAAALRIVCADRIEPVPWKNGGGLTRELLRLPLAGGETDDWLLRISLADIAADGPFSAFDGIERWFAVIDGAGVHLDWPAAGEQPARELAVHPGDAPLCFDGAAAPGCHLLDGPTRDLNVMVRRAAARAELVQAAFGLPQQWPAGPRGFFALRALRLRRPGEPPYDLPARTLAWCDEGDTLPWTIAPALEAGRTLAPAEPAAEAPWPGCWIGLCPEPLS